MNNLHLTHAKQGLTMEITKEMLDSLKINIHTNEDWFRDVISVKILQQFFRGPTVSSVKHVKQYKTWWDMLVHTSFLKKWFEPKYTEVSIHTVEYNIYDVQSLSSVLTPELMKEIGLT